MMASRMKPALIIAWALLLIPSLHARADDAPPCQVHVILFIPSDVKPPTACQPRIDQIVASTEAFLQRGFKQWRHEKIVMPFRRSADGHVEVTTIRGKQKTADYK